MRPLDPIDRAILAALQLDGRTAISALAREVGLSNTACTERVRNLESAGIITGYTAVLDAAKLGLGLTAFIEVSLERISTETFEQFKAAISKHLGG